MKKFIGKPIWLAIAVSALAGFSAYAATSGALLQQALYAEEIEGDLPAAIVHYEEIIAEPSSSQDHVVQALYRLGRCYERIGEEQKAAATLNKLVSRYPDRTELVEKASIMLNKLQYFDPASLMPADTLVYMELGSPGRQVETLLNMLQIAPDENPFAPLMQSTGVALPSGPVATISRFINPSMLAELKKIRSLAVGCPQFDPQGTSSFLCVMHPGESDALRGMIIAALSVAGQPSNPVEGMTVLQIPDGPSVAYDDKVVFIAYPKERLVACINQYKGLRAEPSQAYGSATQPSRSTGSVTLPSLTTGNPTFKKIDKRARQRNAATLWIDVDNLYNHILQQAQDLPPNFQVIGGLLGAAGIDDLLLTHSIEPEGIALNAMVNLKEGVPNMAYDMVKTPVIKAEGLEGVPPEAFYLVSVALSANNPAQFQQLQQMIKVGNGTPLPVEFFENIEQVALFALPGEAKIPEGMPFRPGVVLTCRDTAPVMQLLRELIPESPGLPPLRIVDANQSIVVAFEPEVIEASLEALGNGASILETGVLSDAVRQQSGTAHKMLLMNVGGLVRLLGIQAAFHSGLDSDSVKEIEEVFTLLADQVDSTTLTIRTEEQPKTLSLEAKVSGLPPISALVPAISRFVEARESIRVRQEGLMAAEWAVQPEELMNLPPARVVETATAPVIDGEIDEVWTDAVAYELTKTIYENPGPQEQIAANYRMLWDADKLYVLIEVTDSSPAHDPDQIWQFNDGVEFYLDATDRKPTGYGETEYQFGFPWNANASEVLPLQEQGRTIRAETAMKNTERGYRFEVSFPWSELGTTPAVGARIGVEVQVNDNRGRGERDAKISWHDPSDQAWQNPQYFGRAELVE